MGWAELWDEIPLLVFAALTVCNMRTIMKRVNQLQNSYCIYTDLAIRAICMLFAAFITILYIKCDIFTVFSRSFTILIFTAVGMVVMFLRNHPTELDGVLNFGQWYRNLVILSIGKSFWVIERIWY